MHNQVDPSTVILPLDTVILALCEQKDIESNWTLAGCQQKSCF